MAALLTTTPLITLVASLILGLVLILTKDKSLLQKAIIVCVPGLVLLQLGTYILLSGRFGEFSLAGGNLVLLSISFLTPASTVVALLWGNADDRDALKRFRPLLISQSMVSLVFMALIPFGKVIFIGTGDTSGHVLAFGAYGRYFLIYLIVSSVIILSVFERKLRYFKQVTELRVPTLIFMGIFMVFIIAASQGLLIRTLNVKLLLLVSLCILLGYLVPAVFRMRNTVNLDRLLDNRDTVYSSFTVLLVGAYLVLIGLVGKLIATLGGDIQVFFSAVAAIAVIIVLFMVATSLSIRERIRKFIDRTFYKGKLDYREIWHRFSEQTAFNLNLQELTDAILDTITDILNASSGAVLLVDNDTSMLHTVKKKLWQRAEMSRLARTMNSWIGSGVAASRFVCLTATRSSAIPHHLLK